MNIRTAELEDLNEIYNIEKKVFNDYWSLDLIKSEIIEKKYSRVTVLELKKKIIELRSTYNEVPGLTVILVGEDPPSKIYVKNKEKFAKEVGINSEVIRLSLIHI